MRNPGEIVGSSQSDIVPTTGMSSSDEISKCEKKRCTRSTLCASTHTEGNEDVRISQLKGIDDVSGDHDIEPTTPADAPVLKGVTPKKNEPENEARSTRRVTRSKSAAPPLRASKRNLSSKELDHVATIESNAVENKEIVEMNDEENIAPKPIATRSRAKKTRTETPALPTRSSKRVKK
jgi:hypothetical protein